MRISVVILTHNRNNLLKKCLASVVLGQTKPPDEVVIVNTGADEVDRITAHFAGKGPAVKVVRTENKSLADNRNAGVRAASGELVAFTDDDCIVSAGWISGFHAAFSRDEYIGSAGGRNIDANPRVIAHGIDEVSELVEDYYNRALSPFCYFFCTRNVCYRKDVLHEVGLFEGTYRRSFEDVITGIKVLAGGYKNVYYPGITVRHYGRSGTLKLLKRLFDYGRDMRAGAKRYSDMPFGYVFKAGRPIPYILLSTFIGPVRDAFRFRKSKSPLATLSFSFIMKSCVNAGMILERLVRK